jgi:hypothetical protein
LTAVGTVRLGVDRITEDLLAELQQTPVAFAEPQGRELGTRAAGICSLE